MLRVLLNPIGLVLLLASLVLAVLVATVFDRWSEQAIWLALIGVIAYTASSAVIYLQPRVEDEREENQVLEPRAEPEIPLEPVPKILNETSESHVFKLVSVSARFTSALLVI